MRAYTFDEANCHWEKKKSKKSHWAKNSSSFLRHSRTFHFVLHYNESKIPERRNHFSALLCSALIYMSLCWARSFFSFPIFLRQASRSSSFYSPCNLLALFLCVLHLSLSLFLYLIHLSSAKAEGESQKFLLNHLSLGLYFTSFSSSSSSSSFFFMRSIGLSGQSWTSWMNFISHDSHVYSRNSKRTALTLSHSLCLCLVLFYWYHLLKL